jgi:aspartate/methionine/tyrosine aminotransferase
MSKISQRAQAIAPFYVMDILAQAKALEAQGKSIIHMEVGEPDFNTPQSIVDAGMHAIKNHSMHYTPALGLPALRERIAQWYQTRYAVDVSSERVIVTPGASGAIMLAIGALLEKDHQVMMADPCYPCNRNFARFVEGQSLSVPVTAETDYQLTAAHIEQYWTAHTQLALIASPSNPTGTLISKAQMQALADIVKSKDGTLIVDEIYHGLTYDGIEAETVLSISQDAFVINSFSKFFGMTGWRIGWLIVPDGFTEVMDRLAQNLFLAAPTPAQYAALKAFDADTLDELESRRTVFEQRRNALLPALTELGFSFASRPQGAFYLYADCSDLLQDKYADSRALTQHLLQKAGVAVTPGMDFGQYRADKHCRFAYTNDVDTLMQAVEKIKRAL